MHQAFLIALLVLMIFLLVFSRGYRAARRISFPDGRTAGSEQALPETGPYQVMQTEDLFRDQETALRVLTGQIDPGSDPDFSPIHPDMASREGMYLRLEAYEAFRRMRAAAMADGIELTVLSAMRTFGHQKRIWENKWHGRQVLHGNILATSIADPAGRALEILRFSAMPGTSRHHWGTDVDLNSLQNAYFETKEGKKVYDWLSDRAGDFGFCQPYTPHGEDRAGGYEEEKWHWSYKPLSALFLEAFGSYVTYDHLPDFAGRETAREIGVIEAYVMEIDSECR